MEVGTVIGLLRNTLRRLSSPAEQQLAWLVENQFHADELALEFDDLFPLLNREIEAGRIAPPDIFANVRLADLANHLRGGLEKALGDLLGEEVARRFLDDPTAASAS